MLEKELEKYGFDDKEAKVYLALLELARATIQEISDKSEVNRTTVYYVIEALKSRGLVTEIKKNRKSLFFPEDPRKLETEWDEKRQNLRKMIPELLSISNMLGGKPKVRYFEGERGIQEVYKDTLNYPGQETLAWASQDYSTYFDSDFLWKEYLPRRVEKKIWQRAIAPDSPEVRKFTKLNQEHLRRTKFVSSVGFPFKVEINLYGKNKIGIMGFREKIGMIIESEELFITFKSIFELNWKYLPEEKNFELI